MEIEEDFYSTIKLKNGEEIFAKVSVINEDLKTLLLVLNPVIISEVRRNSNIGYKFEPWIKTSSEDFFILDLNDVLIISESNDELMIKVYNMYISDLKEYSENKKNIKSHGLSKKMGYINNVEDAKNLLENIFKNS